MICKGCTDGHHSECKARNANKQGADCDCQHRAKEKEKAVVEPGT